MSWIETIHYEEADQKLKRLYDRVTGPNNNVDNIMLAHGLRPHTMEGHMNLYKNVLHHASNTLSKTLLETLGVYVSLLNDCNYCVEHHFAGLSRLIDNNEKAGRLLYALKNENLALYFDTAEVAALEYAAKLTKHQNQMSPVDIEILRKNGFDDGQILEINQVVSYFNYANRTVLGLGVDTVGDILGLSPGDSDDPDNWNHG